MGAKVVEKGIVSQVKIDKAKGWFDKNLLLAICVSRVIPGMRLPTYIAAGASRASGKKFLIIALTPSIIWTILLLSLTISLGKAILPVFGIYKWYAAGLMLIVVAVIYIIASRKVSKKLSEE